MPSARTSTVVRPVVDTADDGTVRAFLAVPVTRAIDAVVPSGADVPPSRSRVMGYVVVPELVSGNRPIDVTLPVTGSSEPAGVTAAVWFVDGSGRPHGGLRSKWAHAETASAN